MSSMILVAACNLSKPTAADRVCDEPVGARVTIEGAVEIPRFVNTVYRTRGGAFADYGYQVIVTDRSGGKANVTIWTNALEKPNGSDADSRDLEKDRFRVFSNRGQSIEPGQKAKITGEVVQDPAGCAINAELIEHVETK